LSHTSNPFCSGYFGDGVSVTISLGWPETSILLISASQVARVSGVSHQHLADSDQIYMCVLLLFWFNYWTPERS
jgi:hypothetical protein